MIKVLAKLKKFYQRSSETPYVLKIVELLALKVKLRVLLTGYTDAMATTYVKKMIAISRPINGHLFHIVTTIATDKELLY